MRNLCIVVIFLYLLHFSYACAPGQGLMTYTNGGQECSDCQLGKFSDGGSFQFGDAVCLQCFPGKYANASGMSMCFDCAPGKSSGQGSIEEGECFECLRGTASPGGEQCTACYSGTYRDAPGRAFCHACEPGKFLQDFGSTGPCTNCEPGTFSSTSGSAYCTGCRAVRGYQPQEQSSVCNICPDNTYTSQKTQIQGPCTQCPVGKYANATMIRCEILSETQLPPVFLQEHECPLYGKKK